MKQEVVKQSVFNRLLRRIDSYYPMTCKHRKIPNAEVLFHVLRIMRYGTKWRDTGDSLGERYCWQAVYKRYRRWTKDGTIRRMFKSVVKRYATERIHQDPLWFQDLFIDTTYVKNIKCIECSGRNPTDRGRNGTKISAICDRDRKHVGMITAPANISDCTLVLPTIDSIATDLQTDGRRTIHLIGDRGYSSRSLAAQINQHDRRFTLIASKKKNCKMPVNRQSQSRRGREDMRQRYKVEQSFSNQKDHDRLRVRFDKYINMFESFMWLSESVRMMECFETI